MLKAGLPPALFQDLDQRVGGQMNLFSGDAPFGAGAFAGPGDVAEQRSACVTSKEQPFVQVLRCAAHQYHIAIMISGPVWEFGNRAMGSGDRQGVLVLSVVCCEGVEVDSDRVWADATGQAIGPIRESLASVGLSGQLHLVAFVIGGLVWILDNRAMGGGYC